MAIKAAAEVTITDETDILSLVTWYALTASATPPSKPTTTKTSDAVPSPWTTNEPSFDPSQGTKYLYTVIQTRWKDGSCTWDNDVQLSSAYEQAKQAWNKANAAEAAANATRSQRIYYRKNASGAPAAPGTASTSWVTNGNTESSWTKYNAWSTRIPPIAESKAEGATKYLYLYTCEQREMGDGTLAYTTVLLDDSTTVIDGGNIIMGSISANRLDVYDATIGKISAGAIDTDSIVVGQDQVDGLDDALIELSDNTEQVSTSLSDRLDAELGSFVPDLDKTMEVWGKLTAQQIDVDSLRAAILQVATLIVGNASGVHIDASGSEMAFMNGLDKVAYIDAETGTFYMTKSVVLDDMYFGDGKWKWYKRSNNNMSVKWMG